MDNLEIFRRAACVLEEGHPVALVTVVATTGSTPGKVGYKMLVFGAGATAGTVGGGLLEARMIEQARQMLGRPAVRLLRFEVGETPDDEKGICGGSVEFLLESFDPAAVPLFRELGAGSRDDENAVLVSIFVPAGPPQKLRLPDVNHAGTRLPPAVAAAIREAGLPGGAGIRVSAGDVEAFVESLAVPPTVILFGAGHVSGHIACLARSVHFRIVVCDDRAEYANRQRFPDAEEIVVEDFGRVFNRLRIDGHSYLVIVTRGHQCDQVVLEQAVRTEARYIGMIGSRRKTAILLQKLREKGIPPERLDRVYSPIGVSIGAVTAEEIALSIVCELVKVRRLGDAAGIGHMSRSRGEGGL
ncbi:MAG: XdhC family protein [Planctomycetes bacterium]|jgi:xanthine dehydrogenase accessory factor|nr:XdhC family protein [Planctomycetota bacterium]